MVEGGRRSPRIVVIGPCASGKSTLVERLNARGHDAQVVAQEHSDVRDLWKRKEPDVLVALDVSLGALRDRRTPDWPEAIYHRQQERLASAYATADLTIDTTEHDTESVLEMVESWLKDRDGTG